MSGSLGRERDRSGRRDSVRSDGVISSMTLTTAGFALFLDVSDFPAGRHLAIPADYAAAAKRGEAEKPNETHRVLRPDGEQYTYRDIQASVPRRSSEAATAGVRNTHIGTEMRGVHEERSIVVTSDL